VASSRTTRSPAGRSTPSLPTRCSAWDAAGDGRPCGVNESRFHPMWTTTRLALAIRRAARAVVSKSVLYTPRSRHDRPGRGGSAATNAPDPPFSMPAVHRRPAPPGTRRVMSALLGVGGGGASVRGTTSSRDGDLGTLPATVAARDQRVAFSSHVDDNATRVRDPPCRTSGRVEIGALHAPSFDTTAPDAPAPPPPAPRTLTPLDARRSPTPGAAGNPASHERPTRSPADRAARRPPASAGAPAPTGRGRRVRRGGARARAARPCRSP
jgi:hypothetical protein